MNFIKNKAVKNKTIHKELTKFNVLENLNVQILLNHKSRETVKNLSISMEASPSMI